MGKLLKLSANKLAIQFEFDFGRNRRCDSFDPCSTPEWAEDKSGSRVVAARWASFSVSQVYVGLAPLRTCRPAPRQWETVESVAVTPLGNHFIVRAPHMI